MAIDPRRRDNDESSKKFYQDLLPRTILLTLPPPPSPEDDPPLKKRRQPQGDSVTPLRSEFSPVLISGHINSPTSYILLGDHLCAAPILMALTALLCIDTSLTLSSHVDSLNPLCIGFNPTV